MKHLITGFTLLLMPFIAGAQNDSICQVYIAKAGLLHLQKNYRAAAMLYNSAFQHHRCTEPYTLYKAAGVYALDSNDQKAMETLRAAVAAGFVETDWLNFDPYFNGLRSRHSPEWKQIQGKAAEAEYRYARKLSLPRIRTQVNRMALADQQLRYQQAQATEKVQRRILARQITEAGMQNTRAAAAIIQQYGWPGLSAIGRDGQNNLWLVVQHADDTVAFQRAALDSMKKWLGTNELNPEHYAYLYDRVQCNLNHRQYYGTQVNWTQKGEANGFRPLTGEGLVDRRRKAYGMQPLAIYALSYGFTYTAVTEAAAWQQEQADSMLARRWMDSAVACYRRNDYPSMYDFYNTASTIADGMNRAENYEAAVLFAKVAAITKGQQYKNIALDFLNLLLLRGELDAQSLAVPEFNILAKELRWQLLNRQLAGTHP
jgi:hypothetical protein